MSASVKDHPGINPGSFSASLVETPGAQHTLTVSGEAAGDYRIQDVQLVRSHHQPDPAILVLDVTAKLGPVQNPHPDLMRTWPLSYKEAPARHRYGEVRVVNGGQHFTVKVVAAL